MISISNYKICSIVLDELSLDGGAMFGAVPRSIWEREIPADAKNRISLASRSLIIEGEGRKILVDLGCGEIWSEKEREIYAIKNNLKGPLEEKIPAVTDVVITHLHFDHAGGLSYFRDGKIAPSFPNARHWVGKDNLERAHSPGPRERVSYRKLELDALGLVNLKVIQQGEEIAPNLSFEFVYGHTKGLGCPVIKDAAGVKLIFLSDLCPTSSHLKIPYVMGYDLNAEVSMEEKARILELAYVNKALVVFQHDLRVSSAYLGKDQKGNYFCEEFVDLDVVL